MRQWTKPALHRVMACRMFGAKPLPRPRLAYCQLDSWGQFQLNWNTNSIVFIQENIFGIVVCQNGGHFAQGEIMAMKVSPLCPRLSGLVMGLPWSQQALIAARVTSIESCNRKEMHEYETGFRLFLWYNQNSVYSQQTELLLLSHVRGDFEIQFLLD